MSGGFGLCGIPENLIAALRDSGVKDLTVISNNAGVDDFGLGLLLQTRQIKKMISLLCRREQDLRAAISLRRTGAGIQSAGHAGRTHPRRRRRHSRLLHQDRRRHADRRRQGAQGVRRRDLCPGDAGWSPTCRSSRRGRATPRAIWSIRKTARNFNPMMATAGKVTVAEVEEIVPVGALDPDQIHTPGIFVHADLSRATITKSASRSAPS